jgi:L-lactate utilization protein LutB
MIEKEGASKNRFKNLHDSSIQMILFASALDNEEIPDELVDSCKRIINSKTMALTEQELNNQF